MAEPAENLRYERKFVDFELDPREAEMLVRLHPSVFREAFPPRYVNNVYFDTPSFDHYQANVRGLAERVKCRIRWYGERLGPVARPTLELKRKHGLAGSKEGHGLRPFAFDESFDAGAELEKAEVPLRLRMELAPLRPVLVNRYRRRYYVSQDRRYRLTLDSELAFWPIGGAANRPCARPRLDPRLIAELKFAVGDDEGAARIATRLPFRLSRSSKYVLGVDALYGL
jgi:hypothetical protein